MAEFDLSDLEQISNSREILDLLVEKGIIKEKKFKKQLAYEKELDQLQFELLRLQEYVITNNLRVLVIYEGRDAAGKGGTISRTIEKLNPKKYKVIALSKPTENEARQWYLQRYIQHLPSKGELVFFDRSWYNRAVVEPVFGFCSNEEHEHFMEQIVDFEHLLINEGIVLIKFYLNISKDEQKKRLDDRTHDALKNWKIGGLDKQAQEKWEDYSFYFDKMLKQTSSPISPWLEIKTDDKQTTRLESMKYILTQVKGFVPSTELEIDTKVVINHFGV